MEAMTIRDVTGVFVPDCPPLPLDAWQMDDTARRLTLHVTSTRALVDCPVCRFPTQRIYRRDVRTVADLPWGPWRVVFRLPAWKFFCAHGRGARRALFTGWHRSPWRWGAWPGCE
jgi:hypothetical protein